MTGIPPSPGKPPARPQFGTSLRRPLLLTLGFVSLAIGIAGIVLPLVPGTLFLILAAACFTRSSPRFEARLLNHPRFGPPILRWRETGAIPRRAKGFAIGSLAVSWAILAATAASGAVLISCLALFGAVALYIGTRPDD